ncbi:MAG: DinB family protein, partial [Aureibaculum sp.]|nr:DinB family protein [Aureibaculum sp.]
MSTLPDNEYALFYEPYIEALDNNGKSILENLKDTHIEAVALLKDLTETKQHYRYAEGKWTIKELIQHIIDAERVLSYRALRYARRDAKDLAGFEEDDYVKNSNGDTRDYNDLLEEFSAVRNATILLFNSFTNEALQRIGSANGSIFSVRALCFIISGHLQH